MENKLHPEGGGGGFKKIRKPMVSKSAPDHVLKFSSFVLVSSGYITPDLGGTVDRGKEVSVSMTDFCFC